MAFSKTFGKAFSEPFGAVFGEDEGFLPSNLDGLVLWLDASFGVTKPVVTEWLDRSGNNNKAVQAISANAPSFNATGLNGRPSVLFPTTGMGKIMSVVDDNSLDLTSSFSSFVVMSTVGNVAQQHFFSKDPVYTFRLNVAEVPQTLVDDGLGVQTDNAGAGISISEEVVLSLKYTIGSTIEFRSNGVALGAFPTNTLTGIQTNALDMGIGTKVPNAFNGVFMGELAQILLFNRLLSVDEQNQVGNYLAIRYGLSWTNIV